MKYFNGFSLKNEEVFFSDYLIDSDYAVAGFSYGAQKALEYAYNSQERIDRLILISPAFFQNHKKSFVKTQLRYFKADFLKNVVYPSSLNLDEYVTSGSYDELEALLTYVWEEEKIEMLLKRGVKIEVFMGDSDKIVEAEKSFEFFSALVPVYLLKERGHLLK